MCGDWLLCLGAVSVWSLAFLGQLEVCAAFLCLLGVCVAFLGLPGVFVAFLLELCEMAKPVELPCLRCNTLGERRLVCRSQIAKDMIQG